MTGEMDKKSKYYILSFEKISKPKKRKQSIVFQKGKMVRFVCYYI